MGLGGERHTPVALPPRKTGYPFYRRLVVSKGRSGRVRKIQPPPGFDPRTVQPLASLYTDCVRILRKEYVYEVEHSPNIARLVKSRT